MKRKIRALGAGLKSKAISSPKHIGYEEKCHHSVINYYWTRNIEIKHQLVTKQQTVIA